MYGEITMFVFKYLNSFHMAVLCFVVMGIHLYMVIFHRHKRLPKAFRSLNWFILAAVYLVDSSVQFTLLEGRVLFRLALFLLVLGEVAYYGDVIAEILGRAAARMKKWPTLLNGYRFWLW